MMDLKALKLALNQLEEERNIPKEKILSAIEDALVAAYKGDYGKKGQIIRAKLDLDTGTVEFSQIKIVVDEDSVRMEDDEDGEEIEIEINEDGEEIERKPRFNEEHHLMISDAKKIKKDARLEDEIVFPLETKEDYGRIAAQRAKQVIIQRVREAEKFSTLEEYEDKEESIVSGKVQKIERGNVFVDLGRATAILPREEQIPGEFYRQGERIKAYLYSVEETPRGINLRLSRSHPQFLSKLFEIEVPEIASEIVEIKAVAREAGARSKMAVISHDDSIDPVGSCVGQRGSRVSTVTNELGGEKIDIIEWTEDLEDFVGNALSPAKIGVVELDEEERLATVEVPGDQFSLAVGKGGQNVRLAVKLTGWKIDIKVPEGEEIPTMNKKSEEDTEVVDSEEKKNDGDEIVKEKPEVVEDKEGEEKTTPKETADKAEETGKEGVNETEEGSERLD